MNASKKEKKRRKREEIDRNLDRNEVGKPSGLSEFEPEKKREKKRRHRSERIGKCINDRGNNGQDVCTGQKHSCTRGNDEYVPTHKMKKRKHWDTTEDFIDADLHKVKKKKKKSKETEKEQMKKKERKNEDTTDECLDVDLQRAKKKKKKSKKKEKENLKKKEKKHKTDATEENLHEDLQITKKKKSKKKEKEKLKKKEKKHEPDATDDHLDVDLLRSKKKKKKSKEKGKKTSSLTLENTFDGNFQDKRKEESGMENNSYLNEESKNQQNERISTEIGEKSVGIDGQVLSEKSKGKHKGTNSKDKSGSNPRKKHTASEITNFSQDEVDCLIHNKWLLGDEDIAKLKDMGIQVRRGKWSKKENEVLQQNMERYLNANHISDPATLIFAYESETEEAKKWRKFASETQFYTKLAKGINRSIFLVYRRVIRSFDERNYRGRYSEEETQELRRLYLLYGRNWAKIGSIMGRSGLSISHRFDTSKGECGAWTNEEVERLKEGVRKVTTTKAGEAVYSNIYWPSVATFVKTRSAEKCRIKWLGCVCWKEYNSSKENWNTKDDLELITRVYNSPAMDEIDLDWFALADSFKSARSPQWLQMKWLRLKKKHCSSSDQMNFEELMDYLYDIRLQELRSDTVIHTEKALNTVG